MATLYRTTTAIVNPEHNARTKYGYRSVAVIPAGTAFIKYGTDEHGHARAVWFASPADRDAIEQATLSTAPSRDRSLCRWLDNDGEPTEPRDWREVRLVTENKWTSAAAVLDKLVAGGSLSIAQVLEAVAALEAEPGPDAA